jgi:hypothetical protein
VVEDGVVVEGIVLESLGAGGVLPVAVVGGGVVESGAARCIVLPVAGVAGSLGPCA